MMRRKQVQQHGHFGSAARTATKDHPRTHAAGAAG
jgi:hypothetical protein